MKDIVEQIADGDITAYEAAAQLSLVTTMLKTLKDRETSLRGFLTDRIDPNDHLTTSLGTVSFKRGAQSKWRVKDPVAFAEWLHANGEETSVEQVVFPLEFATKPDAIEAMVHAHGGEQPDGVEYSGGRADSVAVSLPKDWGSIFSDPKVLQQAGELLGIENIDNQEQEKEEGISEWDKI